MVMLWRTRDDFYVDVRVRELNGRFIASADRPDGPALSFGWGAVEPITDVLAPFDGVIDELLESLPDTSRWSRGMHCSISG